MVKTVFDTSVMEARNSYSLLIGLVVPRPIGWIGSIGLDGIRNLAPYSFFNAFGPTYVGFATIRPDGRMKDTLRNVTDTGVFTVNVVSEDLAGAMNSSSGSYPIDVDEFAAAGVTARPGDVVAAPIVEEAKANLECGVRHTLDLGDGPMASTLVIGEVLRIHVREDLLADGRVDQVRLGAIGRMGGRSYSTTRDQFQMERPQQPPA